MSDTPSWSYLLPANVFPDALSKAFSHLESSFDSSFSFSFGDSEAFAEGVFNSSLKTIAELKTGTVLTCRSYEAQKRSVACGIWLDAAREDFYGDHFWAKRSGLSKFLLEFEIYVSEGTSFSEVTVEYYDKGFVFFDNAQDENLKAFHQSLFSPSVVSMYNHVTTYLRKPDSKEMGEEYSKFLEENPTPDQFAKFFGVSVE